MGPTRWWKEGNLAGCIANAGNSMFNSNGSSNSKFKADVPTTTWTMHAIGPTRNETNDHLMHLRTHSCTHSLSQLTEWIW